nr:L2 protein [human papillomavirus 31]
MRSKRSTKRTKRASATQLYQTCKAAGTCPSDVIPKIEHTTIADQILRYGSMGVFFGGLGIGSGSGTGGRTGYVPLSTRPSTVSEASIPIRPPVSIDPVGPLDPSIVSLVEESGIIDVGAPAPIPHPPTTSGFDIATTADTTPAILDVTSVSTHENPTFTDPSVLQPPTPAETSGHLLLSSSSISTHNYEEIPMDTFIVSTNNENITSSTPIPGVRRPARLGLYSKATQQVKVIDPTFLSAPKQLITYENPAYETVNADESLYFSNTSHNMAPDPDFLDIIALHRPALTSRRNTVRYSRLGNKQTLRTRSGATIGARVHYYYDISSINPAGESIEMQPLGASATTASTLNDGLYDIYADTDFTVDTPATHNVSPTTALQSTSAVSAYVPTNTTVPLSTGFDIPIFSGPDVPIEHAPTQVFPFPLAPTTPQVSIFVDGGDFYLHPSYYMLKRRRKRVSYFFTDVSVAA